MSFDGRGSPSLIPVDERGVPLAKVSGNTAKRVRTRTGGPRGYVAGTGASSEPGERTPRYEFADVKNVQWDPLTAHRFERQTQSKTRAIKDLTKAAVKLKPDLSDTLEHRRDLARLHGISTDTDPVHYGLVPGEKCAEPTPVKLKKARDNSSSWTRIKLLEALGLPLSSEWLEALAKAVKKFKKGQVKKTELRTRTVELVLKYYDTVDDKLMKHPEDANGWIDMGEWGVLGQFHCPVKLRPKAKDPEANTCAVQWKDNPAPKRALAVLDTNESQHRKKRGHGLDEDELSEETKADRDTAIPLDAWFAALNGRRPDESEYADYDDDENLDSQKPQSVLRTIEHRHPKVVWPERPIPAWKPPAKEKKTSDKPVLKRWENEERFGDGDLDDMTQKERSYLFACRAARSCGYDPLFKDPPPAQQNTQNFPAFPPQNVSQPLMAFRGWPPALESKRVRIQVGRVKADRDRIDVFYDYGSDTITSKDPKRTTDACSYVARGSAEIIDKQPPFDYYDSNTQRVRVIPRAVVPRGLCEMDDNGKHALSLRRMLGVPSLAGLIKIWLVEDTMKPTPRKRGRPSDMRRILEKGYLTEDEALKLLGISETIFQTPTPAKDELDETLAAIRQKLGSEDVLADPTVRFQAHTLAHRQVFPRGNEFHSKFRWHGSPLPEHDQAEAGRESPVRLPRYTGIDLGRGLTGHGGWCFPHSVTVVRPGAEWRDLDAQFQRDFQFPQYTEIQMALCEMRRRDSLRKHYYQVRVVENDQRLFQSSMLAPFAVAWLPVDTLPRPLCTSLPVVFPRDLFFVCAGVTRFNTVHLVCAVDLKNPRGLNVGHCLLAKKERSQLVILQPFLRP